MSHTVRTLLSRVALVVAPLTLTLTVAPRAEAQSYNPRSTYANPDETTTRVWRQKNLCSDPWIAIALTNVYGSVDAARCSASLYNGGQWKDFNALQHAVGQTKNWPSIDLRKVSWSEVSDTSVTLRTPDRITIGTVSSGALQLDPSLVSSMVAAGGGNLVGNDGASMVAAGGGNLIGNDVAGLKAAFNAKLVPAIDAKLTGATLVKQSGAQYKLTSVTRYSDLKAATRRR